MINNIRKVINGKKYFTIEEFNKWVSFVYKRKYKVWHIEALRIYLSESIFDFLDPKYHFLYSLNIKSWQFEIDSSKIDYNI